MTDKSVNIKDLDIDELTDFLKDLGEKPFRAKQVYGWMYKSAANFSDMTDLSKDLRKKLDENAKLYSLTLVDAKESKQDETVKFLYETEDKEAIEAVFMKYKYGNSICISSQAGCNMGCGFCASGINGLSRNLTPGEMIDQLLISQMVTGEEIRHIVVMGTGEPFDNYDNVVKAVKNLTDPAGLALSRRNITVSTCGIIPFMTKFSEDLPQVNLAVSLHASNDEIRNKIMPINKRYNISDVISASKEYVKRTGRRITFEYALIHGVNDKQEDAYELAGLLKGINCHVNLIPLNTVSEFNYKSTGRKDLDSFKDILEEKNIQVTIRRELGSDIDAACGQLRLKNM